MLTDSQVILTIFDPIECRVTNFTNFPNLAYQLKCENLVEERFIREDVSIFLLADALMQYYEFLFKKDKEDGDLQHHMLPKKRMKTAKQDRG